MSFTMVSHYRKGNDDKSIPDDIVGLVLGLIGGTVTGSLLWPVCMLLYGPVGGVLMGALVAGLSGVSIQKLLSQQDRPLSSMIPLVIFSSLAIMLSIAIGSTKDQETQSN